jgi:O-antigen/teichoic acid export membrane protein
LVQNKNLFTRIVVETLNYGFANIASKFVGFLLIPVYTKYFTPEDYGIVELCGTLSLFLIVFLRLGIPGAISRFYFDFYTDRIKLNNYLTTIYRFLLGFDAIIGFILLVVFYLFENKIIPGTPFFPIILLVILQSFVSSNSEIHKRLLRASIKSRYSAKLSLILLFSVY